MTLDMAKKGISLGKACQVMMDIAPLRFGEDWDNIGLLVEPTKKITLERILLAIDLTEAVMDEAIALNASMIVAYHPPLFAPIKRLTQSDAKSRTILKAIQANIPIYSPHTALDNVHGGVNDWLADGLGPSSRIALKAVPDQAEHPGTGRLVTLADAIPLTELCDRIKAHLALKYVRCATAMRHQGQNATSVSTIALCAGAGASVIGVANAHVYLTGEMRHHDVLRANEAGTTVIVCDHTNTERGYLPTLKQQLDSKLPDLEVLISQADREPLDVV